MSPHLALDRTITMLRSCVHRGLDQDSSRDDQPVAYFQLFKYHQHNSPSTSTECRDFKADRRVTTKSIALLLGQSLNASLHDRW